MKKSVIYSVILALGFVSCMKEKTVVLDDNVNAELTGETRTVVFSAGSFTKTDISPEGAVLWEEGDEISVYYVNSSNVAVEKKATAKVYAGGTAVFQIEIPAQESPSHYYASYPAGCGTLLAASGSFPEEFSIAFGPSDGTFKKSNYMAAYSDASALKFDFKNAGAIVRVQIKDGGRIVKGEKSMDISAVRVESRSGSHVLSSTALPVLVSEGAVSGFGLPSGTVAETAVAQKIASSTLSGSYIYVPVLPCEMANGFVIGFDVSQNEKVPAWTSADKAVTFSRSHIVSVSNAIDRIVWDYYVSPDGNGDGTSEASPMSLEAMSDMILQAGESAGLKHIIDGTTFHLEGDATFDASKALAFNFAKCDDLTLSIGGAWKKAGKTVLDADLTQKFINMASSGACVSFRDIVFYKGQDHDAGNGGAVSASEGTLNFNNCDFISNCAGAKLGGAMYLTSVANVNARDCRFIDNSCTGNSGGAISVSSSGRGSYYFTNCIFHLNNTGQYYGSAIHAAKATGFMGLNNCLFYDNHGTKKGTTDGPSNINIAVPHCIINSTFISPVITYANVMGFRCGADSFGNSLLVNNIIINENEASGSFVPYALSTVNSSYRLRSAGYNQYNSYNDNDYTLVDMSDNLISCPMLGNKPTLYSYTWDAQTFMWAWDASSKIGDMPDMETLVALVENDKVGGVKSEICDKANAFLDWLRSCTYNNGSDNALSVDLYGAPRDVDAVWPGCYQKNN